MLRNEKMIETQNVEPVKIDTISEWTQLKKEFNSIIYRCKDKMANTESREGIQTVFVEGMNDLIGLFQE
jgi:hypothetical protein